MEDPASLPNPDTGADHDSIPVNEKCPLANFCSENDLDSADHPSDAQKRGGDSVVSASPKALG
jgi:hypothetical protein